MNTNTKKLALSLLSLSLAACAAGPTAKSGKDATPRESTPVEASASTSTTAEASRGGQADGITTVREAAPRHFAPSRGKILMVLANPSVSEQTGWPIGVWAAELTHPYHTFAEAGYEVVLASPAGGEVAFDGYSDPRHESGYSKHDLTSLGFINTPELMERVATTAKLSEVRAEEFDAIFVAGGQSPMYTFRENGELKSFFAAFYETGKPSAVVCHGTVILLDAKLSDGSLLVEGKTWTGFADSEEQFADKAAGQRIQPFWIETEARKLSRTTFKVAERFAPHAIADGNLITGQQQNSGILAAKLVLEQLEASE